MAVLHGGSQFWLRLIGGYFINPAKLPMQVELKSTKESGADQATVQLTIIPDISVSSSDRVPGAIASLARRIPSRSTVEAQFRSVLWLSSSGDKCGYSASHTSRDIDAP